MGWIDEEMRWCVLRVRVGYWKEKFLLMTLAGDADCNGVANVPFDSLLQWTSLTANEVRQALRSMRVQNIVDFDGDPGAGTLYQLNVGFWGTPRQDGITDKPEDQ